MKDLIIRTVYGLVFALVVAGSILTDKWLLAILLVLVVGFGTDEMIRLRINAKSGLCDRLLMISLPILLFSLLAAVALQLLPFKYLTLSIIILLFPFLHALFSKQYTFTDLAGMYWPAFFLVALPSGLMLFFYSNVLLGDIAGSYLLLSIIILVWLNDIFAYLVGIKFGKHRLFERISPKKSWEGSIGGLVFTVISALLFSEFTGLITAGKAAGIAILVVISGSLGDLIESMIKRQAGVKDSGKIIPGHGGILDRFDATFYAIPFVFVYLILIY
ncbi:MAG: phosphatidate cytidylyltransferase [Bacteroidales bacterium]|jgi:phosphatidate cytidylyltransferase|nr:phosphatidate cytidylyltransferase [Bacteroidales bacterium]